MGGPAGSGGLIPAGVLSHGLGRVQGSSLGGFSQKTSWLGRCFTLNLQNLQSFFVALFGFFVAVLWMGCVLWFFVAALCLECSLLPNTQPPAPHQTASPGAKPSQPTLATHCPHTP